MNKFHHVHSLSGAAILPLVLIACMVGAGPAPTEPPLLAGAGPVWDIAKAWQAHSSTRDKVCINGLWLFRSATIPEPTPVCSDGFEDAGLSGWRLAETAPKSCKAEWDRAVKKSGTGAMRITFDLPPRTNFYHLTKEIVVKPATPYRLSAWVRTDLEAGYVTLEVQDIRNRFEKNNTVVFLAKATNKIAGKTSWKKVEIDFRIKPGAGKVRLYIRNYSGQDGLRGRVWLDDVTVKEQTVSLADVTPPTDDAWGFSKVPGNPKSPVMVTYWHRDDPMRKKSGALRFAWYQRQVNIPADWTGRRIVVAFDRVSTELLLFCNGRRAGKIGWFGGELDVTDLVQSGHVARLTALVHGMAPGEVSELFSEQRARPGRRQAGSCGISGDVWVESMPATGPRVGPFLVETRVAGMTVTVHTELTGLSAAGAPAGLSLRCRVLDGDRTVKEFSAPVSAGAATANAAAPWPDAVLWDVGKPRLYTMRVSLIRGSRVLDESLPEKFGFREFEIRGRFFYLNGIKINIHPCAYYVGRLYTLDPNCIDRWFDRIAAEGRNFVYVQTVDSPNRIEALQPVLRVADQKGIMVAITPLQINGFWDRLDEPEVRKPYQDALRIRAHRVWNHPSLVLYRMNMNFCGYNQDQNPLVLDGERYPAPDSRLGKKFAAAVKSSRIMESIDPTRKTYHHASGNAGDIYTLNNYLCWPVPQDLREWLTVWAKRGTKPLMMVEFDLPYPGSFDMLDADNRWRSEPLMTEYGAILLGERSYALEDDDYVDFTDQAWNRQTRKWESAYGYYCSAVAPILDECSSLYYRTVFPAWRTWGISGGMNPWEYATVRLKKRAAKPSNGWGMRVRPPDVPVSTDWAHLQRPGFAPDKFIYDCRGNGHSNTYLFPGLPSEAEYLEPTKWGRALPKLLRSLYAYVAGPGPDWPEQDHAYYAGETVRKSVVLINDRRVPATFTVRWQAVLAGRNVGAGSARLTVAPGEKGQAPIEFHAPAVAARTGGEIRAQVTVHGTVVPVKPFAVQVWPKPRPLTTPAGWALYDPKGRTAAALHGVGIDFPRVKNGRLPAGLKVLAIGSEALDPTTRPAFFHELADQVPAGLQVLFFAQTPEALRTWFGLRAFTRAPRKVWIRDAANPFVRGLSNPDLADWRGRTTLGPLDGPPASLEQSQRWKRVWRCSQRGTVASTIVEKPHVGSFRPILDCEFDLRYMTLWEVFEGQGRMVFCQMDLRDRLGKDPAADRLAANLFAAMDAWTAAKPASAALVVSDAGLRDFLPLKLDATVNPVLPPGPETLLILGKGSASWLFRNRALMKRFFAKGGHAMAAGLEPDDAQVLALATGGALVLERKTLSTTVLSGPLPKVFRGVGPAEVHWRERRTVLAVASVPPNGWRAPTGTLARVPVGAGEIVWISVSPTDFDPARRPDLIFTRVNVSRLLALTLTNAGARSGVAWTACFRAARPVPELSLAGVWRARKDPDAVGVAKGWMKPELTEKGPGWTDMKQPGWWGETHPDWYGFLGDVWVRTRFKVPESYRGLPLEFFAKAIDDVDDTWVNGRLIGRTTRDTPQWWIAERHYPIPPGLLKFGAGENVLAVRVNNNFQDAGLLGKVAIRVPRRLDPFPVRHYIDTRVPRDDPYAYMRW